MNTGRLLSAVAASGLLAAAACGSFGSDGGSGTSGTDGGDPASADAATDAASGDAQGCPTVFTEDFSDPTAIGASGAWSWDKPQTNLPGDAGIATGFPAGPSLDGGALVATVDAPPDGGVAEAAIVRSVLIQPGTLKGAELRFRMLFHDDEAPYGNMGCELRLEDDNAVGYVAALLTISRVAPGKISLDMKPFGLDAGNPPGVNLSTFTFQKDTWFPVSLRIRVDSPTRGTLSLEEPATATIPSVAIPANTTALRVHCGLHYVEGPGRTTVALDDVSLRVCGP